jgi:hypothetical protein
LHRVSQWVEHLNRSLHKQQLLRYAKPSMISFGIEAEHLF